MDTDKDEAWTNASIDNVGDKGCMNRDKDDTKSNNTEKCKKREWIR
jgi:hypothetical protein